MSLEESLGLPTSDYPYAIEYDRLAHNFVRNKLTQANRSKRGSSPTQAQSEESALAQADPPY